MNRGLLPTYQTYINKFGTLNNARKVAGLPILIPVGNRWIEQKILVNQLEKVK